MQRRLQIDSFGNDPVETRGDERAAYIRWNVLALEDELHEAMNETGWKPWASSRHLHINEYVKELVDAWHFFLNLLLSTGLEPDALANVFEREYFRKHKINAKRQKDGYDGVTMKCPNCKRELTDFDYVPGANGEPIWVGRDDSPLPHLETCQG